MFSGKAHHRKVMRALKEESTDQDVFFKKKYKHLIEDNVKSGEWLWFSLELVSYCVLTCLMCSIHRRNVWRDVTICDSLKVIKWDNVRCDISLRVYLSEMWRVSLSFMYCAIYMMNMVKFTSPGLYSMEFILEHKLYLPEPPGTATQPSFSRGHSDL